MKLYQYTTQLLKIVKKMDSYWLKNVHNITNSTLTPCL